MYDLVVIGSGPAGEKGAAQAAYFGKRVALIEREPVLGGACVNTGTIPSKTLRESALHLSGFDQRGYRSAVDVSMKSELSVRAFMHRKDLVVEKEWERIDANLLRHKIDRYQGTASFRSANSLVVTSSLGEQFLEAAVFLIATGSSPYRPKDVPFDDELICDSDSILHIGRIPESLVVVGAGVIGCEYASIFAALGVDVHLMDGRTTLLPHLDREVVRILLGELENRLGVTLHLGCDVASIVHCDGRVALTMSDGRQLLTGMVLYAAGRRSTPAAASTTGPTCRTSTPRAT
jgi:NAD(P) transhydrogenase